MKNDEIWTEKLEAVRSVVLTRFNDDTYGDLCVAVFAGQISANPHAPNINGFLIGAARNIYFNRIRSADRRKSREACFALRSCLTDVRTPFVNLCGTEEARLLEDLIEKMPEKFQKAIRQFYLNSHSIKEIGQQLRVSPGCVKSRLFYGRQWLAAKITLADFSRN